MLRIEILKITYLLVFIDFNFTVLFRNLRQLDSNFWKDECSSSYGRRVCMIRLPSFLSHPQPSRHFFWSIYMKMACICKDTG
uniref:Uncharacterized protein n=1 Tax=Varanus komodoensis TaxID=61221 RepID=A0A8D2KZG8_VARKO